MQTEPITRPMYGLYRCPFCTSDDLVDADIEHEHDGLCGDREWADTLEPLWTNEDDYWPLCPCCGRRGELIVPLVPLEL